MLISKSESFLIKYNAGEFLIECVPVLYAKPKIEIFLNEILFFIFFKIF